MSLSGLDILLILMGSLVTLAAAITAFFYFRAKRQKKKRRPSEPAEADKNLELNSTPCSSSGGPCPRKIQPKTKKVEVDPETSQPTYYSPYQNTQFQQGQAYYYPHPPNYNPHPPPGQSLSQTQQTEKGPDPVLQQNTGETSPPRET